MGKQAKGDRKGKKAWRANIRTDNIEDFFEKSTKDALSGGSLAAVPGDSLFFVDKSSDLSVKRKIEKHREKVLRSDSVLQRNAFVQPVPSSTKKKSNKKRKESQIPKEPTEDGCKGENVSDSGMVDIWDGEGEQDSKKKKISKPSLIPAVEVEPPGCSFNPSFESHQDSLAHAVADEMQKVYQNELGPQPVPLTVTGEAVDEEEMYFIEADNDSDDDQNGGELCEDTAQGKRREEFRVVKWEDMDKAERRPLRRIPLSDCTNTSVVAAVSGGVRAAKSSSAKSVARPTKAHISNKRKPEQNTSSRSDTGSNDIRKAPNPSSLNDSVSPPPPKASTPVRASDSSSNLSSGKVDDGVFEPLTVYNRRNTTAKRKGKEKAVAEPLSCPPLERMRDELNEDGDTHLSKSYTTLNRKKRRVPKNDLSQDFIEQQKAYFAEVDAFELPEEVVSDSELE